MNLKQTLTELSAALALDTQQLQRELDELSRLTDCAPADAALPQPARAVTRIVFTPRDTEARAWLKSLAREAGLHVHDDAVGNIFMRWQGTEPSLPAVGTGSHTDAIPHAGMYDGTVGVLGGLAAIRALQRSGFRPRRSIELVMLTSEEPTRFGIGCLGSRLLGGALAPAAADALPDRLHETDTAAQPGGTLRDVRHAAGFTGELDTVRLRAGHYNAWVELHIEQGPLLERDGLPIGVVEAIAAPASYRFLVEGVGGHAGALLMPERRDALTAAAEIILAVEELTLAANERARAAGQSGVDSVGTVGTVAVHPGAVNSVPSRVTLMLDIRDTDAARREHTMQQLRERIAALQTRRGVRVTEQLINADPPAISDPAIVAAIEAACDAVAGTKSHMRMVSRAYHDTSFMAAIAPVAMIFIPCRGGVSHRPDEYATPEAIAEGATVLALTLAQLAV